MTVRSGVKVGFTGAGGTGKTTTAVALAKELGVQMMKSASRTAYEQLKITEADCLKMDDKAKWELQGKIFGLKQTMDDNSFEFIADRTLLDHWAYCLMYCAPFISEPEFHQFENNVRKHMKSTYTHLFYFPWGYWTPETEDGVRQVAPGWQSAIDAIIVGYCVRWNLPAIQVPQLNGPEFRQDFVKKHILGENK